jgi:type VI secretion system protein ImpL
MLLNLSVDVAHEVGKVGAGEILAALREQVTPKCKIVSGHYPFTKGGPDLEPGDFTGIFAANGVMDKFFHKYLEPYVDSSKSPWAWTPDAAELQHTLQTDTLPAFQRAAQIKKMYFGDGSAPMLQFFVKPSAVNIPGLNVRFEMEGTPATNPAPPPPGPPGTPQLQPSPTSSSGVPVNWPGAMGASQILVSVGTAPPIQFAHSDAGFWSLFRSLEKGQLTFAGPATSVRYQIAIQNAPFELRYDIPTTSNSTASLNPLNLATLRDFRCPNG